MHKDKRKNMHMHTHGQKKQTQVHIHAHELFFHLLHCSLFSVVSPLSIFLCSLFFYPILNIVLSPVIIHLVLVLCFSFSFSGSVASSFSKLMVMCVLMLFLFSMSMSVSVDSCLYFNPLSIPFPVSRSFSLFFHALFLSFSLSLPSDRVDAGVP